MSNSIKANIETVRKRINNASKRVGRSADDVTLLAVSKTHPPEMVFEACQAGLWHFGENRVKEGCEQVEAVEAGMLGTELPQWHFIGHLQRRQVGADVLGKFSLFHSVDSLKLAERINRMAKNFDYPPVEILLQCNISGEAAKSGFNLNSWASDKVQLGSFLEIATRINSLNKVVIKGLMTMASFSSNTKDSRPTFRSLASLQTVLQEKIPQIDWGQLSMGMTNNFETAIEEGATIVRVGRAIFGERG